MITLITGAPGSGKTLYTIDKLIQPLIGTSVIGTNDDGEAETFDRIIYTNINGLLVEHELIDSEWLQKLHENKKPGMVVVFDEVQRVWPNRVTGSKKPEAVQYLETHRHDGIDVILMTQNPQLLDPAVRALVGRHLHMRRVGAISAAVVYEWDACSNGLNFKNSFKKTPYRYSKKVFGLYKSAKVHTKQTRSVPFAMWVAAAGVLGSFFLVPRFFQTLEGKKLETLSKSEAAPAAPIPGQAVPGMQSPGQQHAMSRDEYFASLRPRHLGLPHTAPRYDAITQPQRAPVPAACLESKANGCKCWSQDATPMVVPLPTCQAIVAGGLFLDFKQDRHEGMMQAGLVGTSAHAAQPAPVDEGLTPGDIARLTRATTGSNPWARSAGVAPDTTTIPPDLGRTTITAPGPASSNRL